MKSHPLLPFYTQHHTTSVMFAAWETSRLVSRACASGNLACLQSHLDLVKEKASAWVCTACEHGQFSVVQWILSFQRSADAAPPSIELYERLFRTACEIGHLEMAQWLLHEQPALNLSSLNEYAFRYACAYGHLFVAQWLLTVKPSIDVSALNDYAFRYACSYNHPEVVHWLLHNIKPTLDVSVENHFAFRMACANGALTIAQRLWALCPSSLTAEHGTEALELACFNGELAVAQWLLETLFGNALSIALYVKVFPRACAGGHLETVQWLHARRSLPLGVAGQVFANAFYSACAANNGTPVAQWLFTVMPTLDITANNHKAFVVAQQLQQWDTVEWLSTIRPLKYKCIRNGHGRVVGGFVVPHNFHLELLMGRRSAENRSSLQCCICLNNHVDSSGDDPFVESNCRHTYCLSCANTYFTHSYITCAYCRQPIHQLQPVKWGVTK